MISYSVILFHFRMKFEVLSSFLVPFLLFSWKTDNCASCISLFVFFISLDRLYLRCTRADKLLYLSSLIKNRILSFLRMIIIFFLYFFSSGLKYGTKFSLSVISTGYHYTFYYLAICYAYFIFTTFYHHFILRRSIFGRCW